MVCHRQQTMIVQDSGEPGGHQIILTASRSPAEQVIG